MRWSTSGGDFFDFGGGVIPTECAEHARLSVLLMLMLMRK
jgi:hypothetical protein